MRMNPMHPEHLGTGSVISGPNKCGLIRPWRPRKRPAAHNRFNSSRLSRMSSFVRFRSAMASTEYNPCFQRARRDLASPSGVRGPVLPPPCIRHRPLGNAGDLQAVPLRVMAPQRGAEFGLPGRLPFFSQPLPGPVACSSALLRAIFCRGLSKTRMSHGAHDRLAAVVDIYVPNDHLLADFSSIAIQSFHLRSKSS